MIENEMSLLHKFVVGMIPFYYGKMLLKICLFEWNCRGQVWKIHDISLIGLENDKFVWMLKHIEEFWVEVGVLFGCSKRYWMVIGSLGWLVQLIQPQSRNCKGFGGQRCSSHLGKIVMVRRGIELGGNF